MPPKKETKKRKAKLSVADEVSSKKRVTKKKQVKKEGQTITQKVTVNIGAGAKKTSKKKKSAAAVPPQKDAYALTRPVAVYTQAPSTQKDETYGDVVRKLSDTITMLRLTDSKKEYIPMLPAPTQGQMLLEAARRGELPSPQALPTLQVQTAGPETVERLEGAGAGPSQQLPRTYTFAELNTIVEQNKDRITAVGRGELSRVRKMSKLQKEEYLRGYGYIS